MVRIGAFAQDLSRTNTWWRDPDWERYDDDLVAARESGIDYHPRCLDNLVTGALYVLRGPRRVGKTVAVKRAISQLCRDGVQPRRIVHAVVDGWSADELRTLVDVGRQTSGRDVKPRWWFIDEITGVRDDWASVIKWLRDNDPAFRQDTVVLTGSSAHGLTRAVGVLAGRRGKTADVDRTLLPMGFRTFAQLLEPTFDRSDHPRLGLDELRSRRASEAYDDLIPWLDALAHAWETYLVCGGFPVAAASALNGEEIPTWFVNDIFNIAFRQAFANAEFSEAQTQALLNRVAEGLASPFNASKVAAELAVSPDTIDRRIDDLRQSYLILPCRQKDERSFVERPRSQPKLYATDPLVARLAHLRNQTYGESDMTKLTENQLGVALVRRLEADEPGTWAGFAQIFYARTPTRKEIDFVASALNGVAVEAKYTQRGTWARDAATVNASPYAGLLATRNVLDVTSDGTDAWAVPASVLAYAIDT